MVATRTILAAVIIGAVLSALVLVFMVSQDNFDVCDLNKDGVVDTKEVDFCRGSTDTDTGTSDTGITDTPTPTRRPTRPGDFLITHIHSPENGRIAVKIDLPLNPRYSDGAPIAVMASTWFVEKYDSKDIGFYSEYDPTAIGAISITHLWPGKRDPETKISSDGEYDYGGPKSLAALRDTIRFASGEITNVDGFYLHELISITPLYNNVGLFASSHAGVVATNVLAYYGESLTSVQYFVGRENPTMAEMYPLELGHFDDRRNPVYNPYYDYKGYTPTDISIDCSHIKWLQNEQYPEGVPYFKVPNGKDYIWSQKGPYMMGKRWFSHSLTQALLDNGVFTLENWPEDLATPEETKKFWPYRITVHNYPLIGEKLPHLKVMLVFATYDHVQAAPDKPHIRQAYDGFHKRAGLWTRLNSDLSYVQAEIHESASRENGFPDNDANTEPRDWYKEAEIWGFAGKLAGELTNRTVPLAGIAEMADRVKTNNWDDNLDSTLVEYRSVNFSGLVAMIPWIAFIVSEYQPQIYLPEFTPGFVQQNRVYST